MTIVFITSTVVMTAEWSEDDIPTQLNNCALTGVSDGATASATVRRITGIFIERP